MADVTVSVDYRLHRQRLAYWAGWLVTTLTCSYERGLRVYMAIARPQYRLNRGRWRRLDA